MFTCSPCSWKMVWNWIWIKHPWALISQIELWTMLFYVFINVFWKFSPRGSVLMHLNLSLSLEVQSGFSRFRTSARAGKVTLERGIRASSISLHCFAGRSSGGLGARAEACLKLERASSGDFTHPVLLQYARADKFTLERVPLLHVRSSGETCARAGRCVSENAFKWASLHPHPILGILRPSLRHLVEDRCRTHRGIRG